jgi:hypothetical protein
VVTIGDFQVKAATASQAIGDGLREMLVTALHNSGGYIVVERMDLQGLAAEQALSRSRMARQGSAVPEQRMDVADVIVHGAVTEFEGEAKGSRTTQPAQLPFSRARCQDGLTIDVRVVDVATGGSWARNASSATRKRLDTLSAEPSARGVGIPWLGMFKARRWKPRSAAASKAVAVGTTIRQRISAGGAGRRIHEAAWLECECVALAAGALVAACAGPCHDQGDDPGGPEPGRRRPGGSREHRLRRLPHEQATEGRVIGERSDKDAFRTDVFTLYIDARLSPSPTGSFRCTPPAGLAEHGLHRSARRRMREVPAGLRRSCWSERRSPQSGDWAR